MSSEIERQTDKPANVSQRLMLILAVGLLLALGILLWWPAEEPSQPVAPPVAPAPVEPAPLPEPIAEPPATEPEVEPSFADQALVEDAEPEQPLPDLNNSDSEVREAVAALSADAVLLQWIVPNEVVRKFVRAVDNMRQGKLVHKHRPLRAPGEPFFADKIGQQYRMSLKAFRRYDPYVEVLENLDMNALVVVYRRYYPLLQEAYGELGFGGRSFHASLLAAIDQLLEAPDVEGEILLTRPSVMFKYSDPALEQLPDTHKLMLRLGPDNRQRVKARLSELRRALAE